ncbi:carbonic anhydrase [Micromonospora cathayae]|uniref:Carbonic anhydrase n=1 Tax=Micromonospora cathayae TaxID=3028804 RepID=A0ABY7ZL22_9ACTN|nr:carbonic anhydrase [Micromonospora sp. HUAS 3]WDZ82992.1 carbonic anhydrase [Micromonospora sp. HUAS 3]
MTDLDPMGRDERPSPAAALAALRAGHARFRAGAAVLPVASGSPAVASGPLAAVFACADPHQPEPGPLFGGSELLTVRTAGLGIGPAVLGSLEYAVAHLRLPLILVLGHESCRLPGGGGHERVRAAAATLRHRSALLDAAVRAGRCAIHGMCWHDPERVLRSVRRTEPPSAPRPPRLRPRASRTAQAH